MKEEFIKLGIDADSAIRRFAGKEAIFFNSLKKHMLDIEAKGIIELSDAKVMDSEELRKYVHGLKGVTANLSIMSANTLLIEIEQSIKSGQTDFLKYEQFYAMYLDLVKKVLGIYAVYEEAEAEPDKAAGSEAECRAYLNRLNECMAHGKARECDEIVTELKGKTWDSFEKSLIDSICNAVENYDYVRAMEIINGI